MEYFDTEVLEGSYIISRRFPLDSTVLNYHGMTKPQRQDNESYKTRITIKYVFPFTNGYIMIESVTHVKIKTNSSTVLFLDSDEKSAHALTFVLTMIENKIDEYAGSLPDLQGRYKKLDEQTIKTSAKQLLQSRFELEN